MGIFAQLGTGLFPMVSIFQKKTAVLVAGEFEGDRPFRGLPCRMVVQMADEDCNAPIVGNRLIEIVVPHGLVARRIPVSSGEKFFQRSVVFDKLIQSVDGPLQQDVLATNE